VRTSLVPAGIAGIANKTDNNINECIRARARRQLSPKRAPTRARFVIINQSADLEDPISGALFGGCLE
jgi:hypothetical protein